MSESKEEFYNGDLIYIGDRFIGTWVGINPSNGSHVIYKEDDNSYKAYHSYQISKRKNT